MQEDQVDPAGLIILFPSVERYHVLLLKIRYSINKNME